MTDPAAPTPGPDGLQSQFPHLRPRRPALLLLLVPVVLYCLTPVVANRIHPLVLGLPFMVFYIVVCTILTWAFVWLTARLDPIYRAGAVEPVPVDYAFGEIGSSENGTSRTGSGRPA